MRHQDTTTVMTPAARCLGTGDDAPYFDADDEDPAAEATLPGPLESTRQPYAGGRRYYEF